MVFAKTKYSGSAKLIAKDNGVALRELGRAFKGGFEAALLLWHQTYRPLHFSRVAYARYGYKRRAGEKFTPHSKPWKKSYTGRKWAAGPRLVGEHHTNPLVFTGRSRTLAMIRDVKATSKGGRALIHARALNWKNPRSPIDMRAEMEIVNDQEADRMVGRFEATMDREIARAFGERELRRAGMVRDSRGRHLRKG